LKRPAAGLGAQPRPKGRPTEAVLKERLPIGERSASNPSTIAGDVPPSRNGCELEWAPVKPSAQRAQISGQHRLMLASISARYASRYSIFDRPASEDRGHLLCDCPIDGEEDGKVEAAEIFPVH
jgi:hypothetical protein